MTLQLPTKGGERTPLGYVLPADMRDYRPHDHAFWVGAVISYRDLPGTMMGASAPAGSLDSMGRPRDRPVIWLDRVRSPLEERCTLAHELVHLEAGHSGSQTDEVEAQVHEVATRWLVSRKTLRWALQEARTDLELELLLGVDERTVKRALRLWPDAPARERLSKGGPPHPLPLEMRGSCERQPVTSRAMGNPTDLAASGHHTLEAAGTLGLGASEGDLEVVEPAADGVGLDVAVDGEGAAAPLHAARAGEDLSGGLEHESVVGTERGHAGGDGLGGVEGLDLGAVGAVVDVGHGVAPGVAAATDSEDDAVSEPHRALRR